MHALFYVTSSSLCSGACNAVLAPSLFTLKKFLEFKKFPLKFLSSWAIRGAQYTFSNQFSANSTVFFVFRKKMISNFGMEFSAPLTTSQQLQEGRMHVKKLTILRFLLVRTVNLLKLDFITVSHVDFRPECQRPSAGHEDGVCILHSLHLLA